MEGVRLSDIIRIAKRLKSWRMGPTILWGFPGLLILTVIHRGFISCVPAVNGVYAICTGIGMAFIRAGNVLA